MLREAEKLELNQISLTGIRSILILGLLIVAPRTFDEIKQALINYKIIDSSHSDDILRIDLNTLKLMGCKIARCSKKTNYKYILQKHPFALTLEEEGIKVLKRVYNRIKQHCTIKELLDFDALFNKLASHVYDSNTKDLLYGISVLKHFDSQMIKDLIADCSQERILTLSYKKTNSPKATVKNLVAQRLVYKNNKFFLYAYDLDNNYQTILNVSRIKEIMSRRIHKVKVDKKDVVIKYVLKDFDSENLLEEEQILENKNSESVIQGSYYNSFVAMQRVLSFGSKCTVVEPLWFRERVINKLKEMRKIYE